MLDLIGDIAIIKKKEDLDFVLNTYKFVKTVLLKKEKIEGKERVAKYEVLWGDGTETIHKEFGLRFKLDVTKVYFSPRLNYERKRVFDLAKESEIVLDMFAGVGPFSILLAKKVKKVYSIDINPWAIKYLKENIKLNKIKNIEVFEGDARKIIEDKDWKNYFDRVIMNLPKNSWEFLDLAEKVTKKDGIIHYYCIDETKEKWKEFDFEKVFERKVIEYGPRKYHWVVDLKKI